MPPTAQAVSIDLPSIDLPTRNWQRWLFAGLSIVLLAVIAQQIGEIDARRLIVDIPSRPEFWLAFMAYYLALPSSEWLIYRRLWKLPLGGFRALLRKLVSNEILLGYSGEASFYAWARRYSGLTGAPFGAIKDVSIASALAGNVATLMMMAIAWPLLGTARGAVDLQRLGLSIVLILLISAAVALFRRKIFSLPACQLRFIFAIHFARLLATTALSAMLWHLALPSVPATSWILLAALQLLVTRLPLLPSKDLVFASATLAIVGGGSAIGRLITTLAGMTLVTHLVIGVALVAADLIEEARA